jgi:hypothetical protein
MAVVPRATFEWDGDEAMRLINTWNHRSALGEINEAVAQIGSYIDSELSDGNGNYCICRLWNVSEVTSTNLAILFPNVKRIRLLDSRVKFFFWNLNIGFLLECHLTNDSLPLHLHASLRYI